MGRSLCRSRVFIHMSNTIRIEREGEIVEFSLNENDFTIDPTNIDAELCNLGRVMLEYGQLETELRLEVDRKKASLDHLVAKLDAEVRTEASKTNTKITEKRIESVITGHPERQAAIESLALSNQYYGLMRHAMRALDAKTGCLQALAYRDRQLMKADSY